MILLKNPYVEATINAQFVKPKILHQQKLGQLCNTNSFNNIRIGQIVKMCLIWTLYAKCKVCSVLLLPYLVLCIL